MIFRCWMETTTRDDLMSTTNALLNIFGANRMNLCPATEEYRKNHPVPSHIICTILKGVPHGSTRLLLEKMLQLLSKAHIVEFASVLQLFSRLFESAYWGPEADTSFIRGVCRSKPLFTFLFSALRDPEQIHPTMGRERRSVAAFIFRFINSCFDKLNIAPTQEIESFLRLLCKHAKLLDILEMMMTQGDTSQIELRTLSPSALCPLKFDCASSFHALYTDQTD